MSDKTIIERIKERALTATETSKKKSQLIDIDFAPRRNSMTEEIKTIANGMGTRKEKVAKLQQLMSELRSYATPHLQACKKGCSTCCYQRVILTETEADVIGDAIKVRPRAIPDNYKQKDINSFGRSTPCPFLHNSECSIYEHRPIACRSYVNMDVDNLLCDFVNWDLARNKKSESVGIPMLGHGPIMDAYVYVCSGEKGADIRDYFKKAKK